MKVKSKIFYLYGVSVVAYLLLLLLPAPDRPTLNKYHLSAAGLRGLDITFIILEALIWFAAFYGYKTLHDYGQLLKGSKDGASIGQLARGLLFLAVGLPFNAILSAVLGIISHHVHSFTAASVIITNYVSVLFPLVGFLWISSAARGLGRFAKTRSNLRVMNIALLIGLALGIGFCCLIVADHANLRTVYHMSPELVMLTLALPYMYAWFQGLFALTELHAYTEKLSGTLYIKAWKRLMLGLSSIIVLSILLQYLGTLTSWLTKLGLGGVLLLLYVLLLLLSAAYILVASGTKKLIRIEKV